jgi:hypothetical protein
MVVANGGARQDAAPDNCDLRELLLTSRRMRVLTLHPEAREAGLGDEMG